jgi:alpha-L-fucosidase
MLIDSVANDGNLLLNVGPNGRGELEPEAVRRLRDIGEWMRLHERAIRGAGSAGLEPPQDGRYTLRGNRLYLHLSAWPLEHLHLPGLAERVEYAQLLNDGSEVQLIRTDPDTKAFATGMGGQPAGTLTLKLPVRRPDVLVPVIELFLRETA